MKDGKIKIAVVGCALQGIGHIERLLADPRVGQVVAVDVRPEILRPLAERLRVATSTDYFALLRDPDLDAVVIVSPNDTHAAMTEAAFAAGKDVLCEKPLAPTVEECRRVVAASRKHKRILHCHFELRHCLIPRRFKEIVDSGEIGELLSMSMIHYRGAFRPQWKGDPRVSGGLALMETCHAIDLCRHIARAEVLELHSFAPRTAIPYYGFADTEYLVLKMERGVIGHLTSCHTRSVDGDGLCDDTGSWDEEKLGHQYEWTLLGSRGAVWYKAVRESGLNVYHHSGEGASWHCRLARVEDFSDKPFSEKMHWFDTAEFVGAVIERRDTYITPEDALQTHEVAFAVERSARLGGAPVRPEIVHRAAH